MRCTSLKGIQLPGVRMIDVEAFKSCDDLVDVEFGTELETIGKLAFYMCGSLRRLKLYGVWSIGLCAFSKCDQLKEVTMLGDVLVNISIQGRAFADCPSLRRIAIPLKEDMISNTVFDDCDGLEKVVPVGRIHETISSLHLESWRKKMRREVRRINRALPTLNTEGIQTVGIQQWIECVLRKMEHFKVEHSTLVREAMALLELALWKAVLNDDENEEEILSQSQEGKAKKVKIDMEAVRRDRRVMAGADVVIKNVLPFLKLLE